MDTLKIWLFIFLLFSPLLLKSQSTQQVNLLIERARQLSNSNPKEALQNAENAEVLAQQIGYKYGLAQSQTLQGFLYLYKFNRPDKAATNHERAFANFRDLYKEKKISQDIVNAFLKNEVNPAFKFVTSDPKIGRKDKKALKSYEDLYAASSTFLAEIVADQQNQINKGKIQESTLASEKNNLILEKSNLVMEKLKLSGTLEQKELEALALSDSLLKRELELKEKALKLSEEKAKTEKLRQQKALQASETRRQRLFIYGLFVVIAMGLALVVFVYINFRNQKKANRLLAQKNEEIKLQNEEINQQKEEIEAQRDNLAELNHELHQQKEEIEAQRDNLEELNHELHQQKEEIRTQRDNLETLNQEIIAQRNQSDKLLTNILPEEIAQELKLTGKTKPKFYEMATVLFTDFKGFTKIAEKLSPEEIVMELDNCFLAFDEIIERFEMEKIKTIGDAFMCAGGLPIPNKTNPIDAVRAGLAMQEFMQKFNEGRVTDGKPVWELRIGIHTGPLVAGVIGKNKFAYDIWGDTVNLAARMEAGGLEGRVNISGETHQIVKDYFDCEYRGKIMAKNKGEIDMYFINKSNV